MIIIEAQKLISGKQYYYPIQRKADRTSFLGCVTASGDFLKPLIVLKRQTVFETLKLHGYTNDKVMFGESKKGYITAQLFLEWINYVFCPYVREKRFQYRYSGPGILIMDGCTAHKDQYLIQTIETTTNCKIFFLPPHSSNQLQVLDLGLFHIHKNNIRNMSLDEKVVLKQ